MLETQPPTEEQRWDSSVVAVRVGSLGKFPAGDASWLKDLLRRPGHWHAALPPVRLPNSKARGHWLLHMSSQANKKNPAQKDAHHVVLPIPGRLDEAKKEAPKKGGQTKD